MIDRRLFFLFFLRQALICGPLHHLGLATAAPATAVASDHRPDERGTAGDTGGANPSPPVTWFFFCLQLVMEGEAATTLVYSLTLSVSLSLYALSAMR